MPWDIQLDPGQTMMIIQYKGQVSPDELDACLMAAKAMAVRTGVMKIMADCLGLTGGHGIMDLFELISRFDSMGIPRTIKEAVLLPNIPSMQKDVSFYETACLNRGYNVRVFHDRADAVRWLSEA